jgi:PAS domain S-box-containing protein
MDITTLQTPLLQHLIDSSHAAMLIIGQDLSICYANASSAATLGYERAQQLVGLPIMQFNPDCPERWQHLMSTAIDDVSIIQETWSCPNGSSAQLDVLVTSINYNGSAALLLQLKCNSCIHLLMQRAAQYDLLLKYSPDAIFLHADGVVLYVNEAAKRIARADSETELLNRTVISYVPENYQELARERLRAVPSHASANEYFIYPLLRVDGKIVEVEVTTSILAIENGTSIMQTILRDVSERRKEEEALRENAAMYQRLVRFLPAPIVVADKDILIYANESAARLLNASSEDQIIGQSIYSFIHPKHYEITQHSIRHLEHSDDPTSFLARTLIGIDGEMIETEISSIRIHRYHNRTVNLSVLRDLTEQLREQERLIRSEKLSVIGQLAAGVAHEIRNPLTSLKGFTQLIHKHLPDKQLYTTIMLQELDRINEIVNEFMALAKPKEACLSQHDMREIVSAVVSILDTQAILKNIQIMTTCGDSLPSIACDSNQMKQVLINLVKNAIEAMNEQGTIEITLTKHDSDQLIVTIRDEGPGMPADLLRRLGEPFITTKENGTGLGLMISQRIVETHNGTLQFHSTPAGTTVEMKLPIAPRT